MKKDHRGFRIYTQFKDTYKSDVMVKMSSSVMKRCWIFVHNEGDQPGSSLMTDGAIHLNQDQAKRLIKALEAFLQDD